MPFYKITQLPALSILFALTFISTSIAFLNVDYLQNAFPAEPTLSMFFSGLALLFTISSKSAPGLLQSELFFFLFIIYIILKGLLTKNFNITSAGYLLFFALLYFGLKLFFFKIPYRFFSVYVLPAIIITPVAYAAFAAYLYYSKQQSFTAFYIPNTSIFSILLSSQLAFIVPLYFKDKVKPLRTSVFFFLILISIFLLGLTKGRSGWLGLSFAVVYMVYQYASRKKIKKAILCFLFPLLIVMFYLLLYYKAASSEGRLLIYKISAGMLKDNWLWGIGHGQFKVRYNEYQAAYFSMHSIDSKEALLAGNSFYAFNDFLQAVIENGLIALLQLAAMLTVLIVHIKKIITHDENRYLVIAAIASLICIVTGALFSYPLQVFPLTLQAVICVAIINSFPSNGQLSIQVKGTGGIFIKAAMMFLGLLLIIHGYFCLSYKIKSHQAFMLKRAGYKQKALELYGELEYNYIGDGNVLYGYAQELYYSNELQHAAQVIARAKKYYCTNDVYKLSAAIENGLHNFTLAERDYKTAIYMVPNKMLSRNDLLEYYLERKDTANAMYWARSIAQMPVKVVSEVTGNMQQKAKAILKPLSQ